MTAVRDPWPFSVVQMRSEGLVHDADAALKSLSVAQYRISEVADLLGVSGDTVRRWVKSGQLPALDETGGRTLIDGARLAEFARERAAAAEDPSAVGRSARNRFVGLVTKVIADTVMAQVEIQAGPHRVVSLMSAEAVRDLGLAPGELAVAVVKATTVVVETPGGAHV